MLRARRFAVVAVAVLTGALLAGACISAPPAAPPQFADRYTDPVVLTGARVPALAGAPVGDIVAFHYTSGAWAQVPVQVDQRKTIELNTAYNQPANTTNPVFVSVYADPNTFVGADDGTLDNDDEIAFMAADTGELAPAGAPANVIAGSRVQLAVTDPLDGHVAYAYLFRRSTTVLLPSAGRQYVQYDFKLTSGDYKTTYKLSAGPNPETSKVTTKFYTRMMHDRWLDDVLSITVGNGADLVDRHKEMFAPGNCVRTEDTFDSGEGAFLANISGPVRGIRSFIGANSGPYTERTQIFYAQREDVVTDLRVHAIPGVMDFMDYSDAAIGMTYTNDHNLGGVTIDGNPDTVAAGPPAWEKVDGSQGSLTHVWSTSTDIAGLTETNYYEDNSTNPVTQCTGDANALGSSGTWITSSLPNTDPHNGAAAHLEATRSMYYETAGRSSADAQRHADQVTHPLAVAAS